MGQRPVKEVRNRYGERIPTICLLLVVRFMVARSGRSQTLLSARRSVA
jgi:hypothetical protein